MVDDDDEEEEEEEEYNDDEDDEDDGSEGGIDDIHESQLLTQSIPADAFDELEEAQTNSAPATATTAATPASASTPTITTSTSSTTAPCISGRLYFDGGSRGNPGKSGCGAVMYSDATNEEIWSLSFYMGANSTNNQAEYTALIHGLEQALARGVQNIKCFGDSKLVVMQVMGRWKVKNPALKALHARATALKQRFRRFAIKYIPREENSVADGLANQAMDKADLRSPFQVFVPAEGGGSGGGGGGGGGGEVERVLVAASAAAGAGAAKKRRL